LFARACNPLALVDLAPGMAAPRCGLDIGVVCGGFAETERRSANGLDRFSTAGAVTKLNAASNFSPRKTRMTRMKSAYRRMNRGCFASSPFAFFRVFGG
jgi:hypothetical protein